MGQHHEMALKGLNVWVRCLLYVKVCEGNTQVVGTQVAGTHTFKPLSVWVR